MDTYGGSCQCSIIVDHVHIFSNISIYNIYILYYISYIAIYIYMYIIIIIIIITIIIIIIMIYSFDGDQSMNFPAIHRSRHLPPGGTVTGELGQSQGIHGIQKLQGQLLGSSQTQTLPGSDGMRNKFQQILNRLFDVFRLKKSAIHFWKLASGPEKTSHFAKTAVPVQFLCRNCILDP